MTSRTRRPHSLARAGVLAVLALVLGAAVAATVGGAGLAARSAQSGDALPPLYLDDASYAEARVEAGLSDPNDPGRALATPPTRSAYVAAVQANLACLVRNGNPKLANRRWDATVQTTDDAYFADAADSLELRTSGFVGEFSQFSDGSICGERDRQYGCAVVVKLLNDWRR